MAKRTDENKNELEIADAPSNARPQDDEGTRTPPTGGVFDYQDSPDDEEPEAYQPMPENAPSPQVVMIGPIVFDFDTDDGMPVVRSASGEVPPIIEGFLSDIMCLTKAGASANRIAETLEIPLPIASVYGAPTIPRDFVVPVRYSVKGGLLVEADTIDEAIGKIQNATPLERVPKAVTSLPDTLSVNDNPYVIDMVTQLLEADLLNGKPTPTRRLSEQEMRRSAKADAAMSGKARVVTATSMSQIDDLLACANDPDDPSVPSPTPHAHEGLVIPIVYDVEGYVTVRTLSVGNTCELVRDKAVTIPYPTNVTAVPHTVMMGDDADQVEMLTRAWELGVAEGLVTPLDALTATQ